jgi:hypothetical protein
VRAVDLHHLHFANVVELELVVGHDYGGSAMQKKAGSR